MPARLDTVSKLICERSDWRISNLQLQKILYMAQMYYMGLNNGRRLVDARFEAWDYGPVVPELYHKVKIFGSDPVGDVFYEARVFRPDDDRKIALDEVCDDLLKKRPGELVDLTHWEHGAWARHYIPGMKGITIPDTDIYREYNERVERFGAAA
jgi:uncharacterized phage-associated protein